jgi:hypothetical protein
MQTRWAKDCTRTYSVDCSAAKAGNTSPDTHKNSGRSTGTDFVRTAAPGTLAA